MKTMNKILAILSVALSFAACQKEEVKSNSEKSTTHSITFVAGAPETKTSASVSGDKVNYSWTKEDEDKFTVYEIVEGEIPVKASLVTASLENEKMTISALFDGDVKAGAKYQAIFNESVSAKQNGIDLTYDQSSDILVSEVVSSEEKDFNNGAVLRFKRLVSIAGATLKNLDKGTHLSGVVIESQDDSKYLAGTYSVVTESFGDFSPRISANVLNTISSQSASFSFVSLPVEDVKLKMTAVTVDDNNHFAGAYEKAFTKSISFSAGDYTSFGVQMTEKTGETIDLSKDLTTTADEDELSWDYPLVNVLVLKDESTTNANNYYPGTVGKTYTSTRFYKGNTLAITPNLGVSISKVIFTATTDGYASALANSSWTNALTVVDGTSVTVVPENGAAEMLALIGATTGHEKIEIVFGEPETILVPCATPVIKLNGAEAEITCATDGATIHYTLDGTDPTADSQVYTTAVTLTEGQTIKAIAIKDGMKASAVAAEKYTAALKVLYTLNPTAGTNSSYAGNCDVIVGGITWNVEGNSLQIPWRFGGKSITKTDRTLYSKTAYPKALNSIKLSFGTASNITVNSCKLVYSTNSNFNDSKECNIAFKASSTVEVKADFPANAYYKFVFNVTVSAKNNKYVELSKIEFLGSEN